MGVYDTFCFKCIFCGKDVCEQTKSGPCMLDTYQFNDPDLPQWVMDEFNEAEIECYECGRTNRIIFDFEVIVKRKAIEPVNNLDYLDLKEKEKNG